MSERDLLKLPANLFLFFRFFELLAFFHRREPKGAEPACRQAGFRRDFFYFFPFLNF